VKPKRPMFDHYDAELAAALGASHERAGGLPGFLGVRVEHVGPGELDVELDVRPELLNPFGNLHGGVIAACCDHVLGTVCYPVMPKGSWAATTEFKLNYLAPVTTGTLRAEARIESLTKRTAVVRIRVLNGDRVTCLAQGTVLVMPPKRPS
jgi:1,4-dihydroxy-2-naphthoyl-CoA hydrolase